MPNDHTHIPRRGAVAQPAVMSLVREITEADLERLALALPTAPPPLQKARAIHHKQAQLLAEGYSVNEVAAIVGSTAQRISLLKNDQTFAELISYYQDQRAEIEFETHRRIQNTLVDVLELAAGEIQERLSDDTARSAVALPELRKLAEFAADRTVAPPRATQQGSALPPTKIELNFGYKPQAEPKTITIEPEQNESPV